MTSIFRFSPISNIKFGFISKIEDSNQSYRFLDVLTQESINSELERKPDDIYENDTGTNVDQIYMEENSTSPNIKVIKLLEDKRRELKRNIEIISVQLKRHIRQVEYIESRIYELRNESLEFQSNKVELDSYQINSSRLSTTVNTGINSPISELANSNSPEFKYYLDLQTEGDWTLIPEFRDFVSKMTSNQGKLS